MANIINLNNGATTCVERSALFNAYMADIKNIPLLTKEEEVELLHRYSHADTQDEKREARDKLLRHNQRFVVGAAKQYANNNVNLLMELLSEGNLAFMEAIETYDASKSKTRLLSWAAFYLRRSFNIYLYRNRTMVRQPYDGAIHTHLVKARNVLSQREGREVADEEIFQYLTEEKNLGITDLGDVRPVQVKSIDTCQSNTEDDFNATIAEYNSVAVNYNHCENTIRDTDNRTLLDIAFDTLDDREKFIFKKMYALDEEQFEESLEAVGRQVGCTSERVRQIHNQGLKKMKAKLTRYLSLAEN